MNNDSIKLISALLENGQYKAAETAARSLPQIQTDPQALVFLAAALGLQAQGSEAVSVYRRVTQLEPGIYMHWSNLGTALREIGELVEAEECYRHALRMKTDDPVLLSNLGMLRWQLGDAIETMELMLIASRLDPNLPEPRIYGALAAYECARDDIAELLLAGHEAWPYLGDLLEPEFVQALIRIGRTSQAEIRLQVLRKQPQHAVSASLYLAALYERLNRLTDAYAVIEPIAQLGDSGLEFEHYVRGVLALRAGEAQDSVLHIQRFLKSHEAGRDDVAALFYLAKAYDRLGDYRNAVRALSDAHAAQCAQAIRLEPALADKNSEPLDIVNQPISRESAKKFTQHWDAPSEMESPIFVVGFPRSGTTLLEQMLGCDPELQSMDERIYLQNLITSMHKLKLSYPNDLTKLTMQQCTILRAQYWQQARSVIDARQNFRLVDKNPLNMLRASMIWRLWPNAPIVFLVRHPCDVIISNFFQNYRAPRFRIMCSELSRLVRSYVRAMTFWLEQQEVLNLRVLYMKYEDLVLKFDLASQSLASHLNLRNSAVLAGFQARALARGYISTPSYAQVAEPLSDKAIGRWQCYRQWLDPLLPELDSVARRFGYSLDE